MITDKQPHAVFSKFTYSDICELFGKSLQRKPRHRQEGAFSSCKVSCITDRSQLNVHRLYQMIVRYVMCSCRKIVWMKTEIHLRKNFDLHAHNLWLLIDRLIARSPICVRCHKWIYSLNYKAINLAAFTVLGIFCTDCFNILRHSLSLFKLN